MPGFKSYKFISGNMFTVCAANKDGRLLYSHCGKCAFDGTNFFEKIELSNNKNLIGVTNSLPSSIIDGKWIISSKNEKEDGYDLKTTQLQNKNSTKLPLKSA